MHAEGVRTVIVVLALVDAWAPVVNSERFSQQRAASI